MKIPLFFSLFVFGVFFIPPAYAEDVVHSKFAVIDIQRALTQSQTGKNAQQRLEKEVKEKQDAISADRAKLDKSKADLVKQASLLSEDALVDRSDALEREGQALGQKVQQTRKRLEELNMKEIGQLVTRIQAIADRIGREQKIPIILERDPKAVVYASSDMDITDRVISELDMKKE